MIDVSLEIGQKRTFVSAIAWPGWCRSGRDEHAALQALFDSGPRYATVLHATHLPFHLPSKPSAFAIVERDEGTTTTDFGAPDIAPSSDMQPVDDVELHRLEVLLEAYWQAFDAVVEDATTKQLRTGPRGGGRELNALVQHVLRAERSYLARLGWKDVPPETAAVWHNRHNLRQAVLHALAAATHHELPVRGPRGGVIWSPRYFVRRAGWHVLDHAREIEQRVIEAAVRS